MIVAAELAPNGNRRAPFDWRERRGLQVYRHGLEHEALLRPIGNVVYFMPPYVITPEQIDTLVATARDGIVEGDGRLPGPAASAHGRPASPAVVPTASTTGLEF